MHRLVHMRPAHPQYAFGLRVSGWCGRVVVRCRRCCRYTTRRCFVGVAVDGMQISLFELTWYTGKPILFQQVHSYTKKGRKYPESTEWSVEDILTCIYRSWSGFDE